MMQQTTFHYCKIIFTQANLIGEINVFTRMKNIYFNKNKNIFRTSTHKQGPGGSAC